MKGEMMGISERVWKIGKKAIKRWVNNIHQTCLFIMLRVCRKQKLPTQINANQKTNPQALANF